MIKKRSTERRTNDAMTPWDEFAKAALQAILSCESTVVGYTDSKTGASWPRQANEFRDMVVDVACGYADIMMLRRSERSRM